eukprot:134660_1
MKYNLNELTIHGRPGALLYKETDIGYNLNLLHIKHLHTSDDYKYSYNWWENERRYMLTKDSTRDNDGKRWKSDIDVHLKAKPESKAYTLFTFNTIGYKYYDNLKKQGIPPYSNTGKLSTLYQLHPTTTCFDSMPKDAYYEMVKR